MTDPVNSVAGRTGNVVLTTNDIVGFNNANFANTAYVDMQLNAIVGGAPGALQTLANLANALNSNTNIASVIINDITVLQANDAVQSSNIRTLQTQVTALQYGNTSVYGRVAALEEANSIQSACLSVINSTVSTIFNGTAQFQDLITLGNGIYNLGSSIHQWKYGYFTDKIFLGGHQLTVDYYGNLRLDGHLVGSGAGGGGGNNLIEGSYIVNLDAAGGLNLAGVGLIRGPSGGAGAINLASDNFVQMQWTANAGNADPNSNWTGSTNWAYVDGGGFHVENITPTSDAYLNFDAAGNLTISGNLILRDTINFPHSQQISTQGTGNNDNFIVFTANTRNDINGMQIGEVDQGATIYTSGTVQLYTNTAGASPQWTFDTIGNLIFPTGSQIVNGYPGTNGSVGDGQSWFVTPSGDGGGLASADGQQYLQVNNGQSVLIGTGWPATAHEWAFGRDGTMLFPGGATLGDVSGTTSFTAPSGGALTLKSSNGYDKVTVNDNYVILRAGDSQWTFDYYGRFNFPSGGNITSFGGGVTTINDDNGINVFQNSQNGFSATAANGVRILSNGYPWNFNSDGSATFPGNVTISGNLILNGNATLIATNNLIINDNIIYIANANPGSSLDIGIAGHFTGTRYQHTGLIRQASTNTWQLFSNVVPEPGGTVDFTNAIYDDIRVGNIISPTITGINANVTAANVGIIGYINLGNTIQSAQVNAANLAITAANVGIKGYVDLANSIQSAQITAANIGIIGYIDQGNSIQATAITTANTGMKGYVDSQTFYSNARVATYLQSGNIANISAAGNITATYFVGNGALLTGIAASSNYSNVQVATYLPTYSGNIANIRLGVAGVLTFADGTTQTTASTGGGSSYSNVNVAAYLNATGYNLYSNVNVAVYLTTATITTTGNITAGNLTSTYGLYVANITTTGSSGNISGANYITANYFVGNGSQLTGLPAGYSNIQVATYLPTYTGVVTASNVAVNGNVTAQYLFGNAAFLTGIAASSNYSNVQVATYLPTYTGNIANIRLGVSGVLTFPDGTTQTTAAAGGGGSSYGNGNVASYLITSGYVNTNSAYANSNVASYLITNGYVNTNSAYANANVTSYLPTHTGNVGVNNIIGTSPNVILVSNSYSTTYDIYGNVAFGNTAYPVQVTAFGNISTGGYLFGNGAFLTGIVASGGSSNYSNVNVLAYLSSVSGNILPTGNAVYSLGSITNQWQHLYVSSNTIYIGGNPVTVSNGSITVNGNSTSGSNLTTYSGNISGAALNLTGATGGVGNIAILNAGNGFTPLTGYTTSGGSGTGFLIYYSLAYNPPFTIFAAGSGYRVGDIITIINDPGNTKSNATAVITSLQNVAPPQITVGNSAYKFGSDGTFTLPTNSTVITSNISAPGTSNLSISSNIVVSGNVTAQYLFGNGALLTGIVAGGSGTNYSNVNVAAYTQTQGYTNYSNVNVASYLSTASITTTGNISAAYVTGNISVVGNVTGTLPNVTIQSGVFTSVFDNQGNVTLPNVYVSGNVQTSGYLFGNGAFLTGIVAGGGGTNYSNANVASYLISSNATFIGNTGNVSSVYSLQSNITQLFIGNQTSLSSGNSSVTTNTWLLNNLFFNSAGNLAIRNTQAGYNYIQMGTNGIMLGGYLGASTANTVASVFTPWMTVNGTSGLVLTGGLTAGAAVAVNSASGVTTNQASFPLVNATATSIQFGGAATSITMGSTAGTANVFFGGNAIIQAANGALGTNLYPLVLRPAGQYNYLSLYNIAGGYNSPPYSGVSPTGGSGNGMVISFSSVGGYISGAITVTNAGSGYRNGDILTIPGGLGTTVLLNNYNAAKLSNTAASSYTFGFDGNLTLPGNIIFPSSSYIYGDFSNATVNSRTVFVTTGNSTTTGIYAVPSGTGTGAAWQAANSSNLTAASKIMITTNGSTDVQLVSGINGTGTYLPLSFYNNGSAQMQLTVAGNLNMSLNNSITANGTGYFIGNTVGTTANYTGNVTVGNLSVLGNLSANLLSITANSITGSGANTYIIAGAYTSTFDNAGNVVLPNVVVTSNTAAGFNGRIYAGNVYATNFIGNISSGSTGNLNVVGNLISTGYGFFPGAYNESATTSGVFIGNTGSGTPSPRIGFYNGNVTQNWQVDNYFGTFRWFTPGVSQMTLDPSGNVSILGTTANALVVSGGTILQGNLTVNGTAGVTMPSRPAFRVSGQGGTVGLNANLTSSNWTVDYTQGNSAAYLNGTNGTFTAPVAGLYSTSLTARTTSNTNGSIIQAVINQIKSGSKGVAMMIEWGTNTTFNHASGSTTVKLAVGDQLFVSCLANGSPGGTGFSFDGNDHWDVVYLG
jgi:hypothetical protein